MEDAMRIIIDCEDKELKISQVTGLEYDLGAKCREYKLKVKEIQIIK